MFRLPIIQQSNKMLEISANPAGVTDTKRSVIVSYPIDVKPILRTEIISPVEFYRRQLVEILANEDISETKIYILAFIKVYGSDYKKHLLESRLCTSLDSIKNYESNLRRCNFISGYHPDIKLNPNIQLQDTNYVLFTFVQIDSNTKDIGHKNYKK